MSREQLENGANRTSRDDVRPKEREAEHVEPEIERDDPKAAASKSVKGAAA